MSDQHNKNGNGFAGHASPPNGADFADEAHAHECLDFCPICRAADILRASAPPELREQWQTVQREALLTTRALIEHYLTRLDEEPAAEPPSRVEDIPIL